ncbi:hypothetical protein ACFKHW_17280 [Bradyrhizobium lupini]|uniref:hypothetical protein n=1 Tax=Rhizobium lupini TaxID=136996 RepID=UPI0036731AEA
MSRRAPYFERFVFLGDVGEPEEQLREKIISGKLRAYVYSTLAKGDSEPVPLLAAKFQTADEVGWEGFSDPTERLPPFQIATPDRDSRRPVAARHRNSVPHWIYLLKADLEPTVIASRYPGDAALLEEGRRMLAAGMEKRAIARQLAPRAEGHSLESKIDRLRKAL